MKGEIGGKAEESEGNEEDGRNLEGEKRKDGRRRET